MLAISSIKIKSPSNKRHGINISSKEAKAIQVLNNNLRENRENSLFSEMSDKELMRFNNLDEPLNIIGGKLQFSSQKIVLDNLPTSDPKEKGQLWNDNGLLKISLGK